MFTCCFLDGYLGAGILVAEGWFAQGSALMEKAAGYAAPHAVFGPSFCPKPPMSLPQGCGTALKPASPPGSIPQELVACARNSCSSNFQLKGNNAVQLQLLLRSCVVQPHFRRHQSHLGIFLHVIIVSRKQQLNITDGTVFLPRCVCVYAMQNLTKVSTGSVQGLIPCCSQ